MYGIHNSNPKDVGLTSKKDHVGNEGAISEQMRLAHIKKERERQEKERAKMELAEKKRRLELNKEDLHRREFEHHRIDEEVQRAQQLVREIERECQEKEQKVHEQKSQVFSLGTEIQKLQLQLQQLKSKQDKQMVVVTHIEAEKSYKQREKEKRVQSVQELETKNKRGSFEIERVRGESTRLEHEIKTLEMKVR